MKTLRVVVLRSFLNGKTVAKLGQEIEANEQRARHLARLGLVRLSAPIPPGPSWPVNRATLPPVYIAIPAWGAYHIDLACRFTIPALLVSLAASNFRDVTFLVHTDDEAPFRQAIGDAGEIRFMPLLPMSERPEKPERLPDNYWVAFKQAHKDALIATPMGSMVVLLNSDIVVSRECFPFVEREMLAGKTAVVSVGIRTQIEDNTGPPIGAAAPELFAWIWAHRHQITVDSTWGEGRSGHPTILYFEEGGNVTMHGFHLTPMFVRRDRAVKFGGTIDDDLLSNFRDDELTFITGGEVAFAEISPTWKTDRVGAPLTVPGVLGFWRHRMTHPHFLRNFRQRLTVLGTPQRNHPAADQIIALLR